MAGHLLIYEGGHPTTWQRFKAHVIEVSVVAASLLLGLTVSLLGLTEHGYVGSSLAVLPTSLVVALGLAHLGGSATALIGLLVTRKRVDVEIHTEQAGWMLISAAWFAFAFAMWRFTDDAFVSIELGLVFGCGSVIRAWVLREVEEQQRRRLRASGVKA